MKFLALPILFAVVGCSAPAPVMPEDMAPILFTPSQLKDQQRRVEGLTVEVTGFVKFADEGYCTLRDDAEPMPIIDVGFAGKETVKPGERLTVRGRAGRAGVEKNIEGAKIVRR